MAEKGFDIKDILVPHSARLNIPPFKSGDRQMNPEDLSITKEIAGIGIHVERRMRCIKEYKLVASEINATLKNIFCST